jgi:hypothetical protein
MYDASKRLHSIKNTLQELPRRESQPQANPDADRGDATAFTEHLPQQDARLGTRRDPDTELARST